MKNLDFWSKTFIFNQTFIFGQTLYFSLKIDKAQQKFLQFFYEFFGENFLPLDQPCYFWLPQILESDFSSRYQDLSKGWKIK